MTAIAQTGFSRLESEGRLLNAVLKAPTRAAGRFGFRGDLALKFADKALTFTADFEQLTYEEGLKRMGPVRNPNENRPV